MPPTTSRPYLLPLKTLSALRMVIGTSCLLIPRQAGAIWGVPLAAGPESVLFARMAGIRDFVLGAYLWKRTGDVEKVRKIGAQEGMGVRTGLLGKTSGFGGQAGATTTAAESRLIDAHAEAETAQDDQALSNIRSALWLGLVCDLVDLASVGIGFIEGNPISGMGEFCIGGGAALFAAVAGQALWAGRRV